MTELSPRARAACAALRADGASDEERERVRARLGALGVAMSVGAGAALTAGTATSAAASVASVGIQAGAPAALPATSLATQAPASLATQVTGSALGGSLAAKGALVTAASAGKLVALPMVVKAGLAAVAVSSALVAPKLFTSPTPIARSATRQEVAVAAQRTPRVRPAQRAQPAVEMKVEPVHTEAARQISTPVPAPAPNTVAPRRQSAAPSRVLPDARLLPSASAPAESTLAAESALLAQALSALRSGQTGQARDLLRRHEEIYGAHALLARERERMRRELSHLLR